MNITEYVLKENYRLDDTAFSKCMNLWRKISKFDSLTGTNVNYNVAGKIYTFFEGYCNVYFIQNQEFDFFEEVLYKGYKKFKRLINSRFAVINELFSKDAESADKFIQAMLRSASVIFQEVEVSFSRQRLISNFL